MDKTIKIDGKDVRFKFSMASFYIFKNQFGYDGLTKLMPMIGEAINSLDPKVFNDNTRDNASILNSLGNILTEQTYFEITEIGNMIWAFAKTADKDIPEPNLWYASFDEFPIFDIGKELLPCLYESLISKKKIAVTTGKAKKK